VVNSGAAAPNNIVREGKDRQEKRPNEFEQYRGPLPYSSTERTAATKIYIVSKEPRTAVPTFSSVGVFTTFSNRKRDMARQDYESCIQACLDCLKACETCAADCFGSGPEMAECLRLCLECAEACQDCARVMMRGSPHGARWCALCADMCDACAVECAKFSKATCRECAEACRRCAQACRSVAVTKAA